MENSVEVVSPFAPRKSALSRRACDFFVGRVLLTRLKRSIVRVRTCHETRPTANNHTLGAKGDKIESVAIELWTRAMPSFWQIEPVNCQRPRQFAAQAIADGMSDDICYHRVAA